MVVLGISAFYHDSAAALVREGEIVAAAQEERFSQVKADSGFPAEAVRYCLKEAGVSLGEVDYVAFYDKPLLTFNRLLETYLAFAPRGLSSFVTAIPVWVKEKILQKSLLRKELDALGLGSVADDRILFNFHHHSHAASAFYPSPFDEAAVVVMDGVGEWATASLGVGRGNALSLLKEIRFPHSLGMLYSAFTYYLGFKVNDGEYKVMGLAPYGEPRFADLIREHLIELRSDGSYRMDLRYFDYCTGLTMTNTRFAALFGMPRRKPQEPLQQVHMDVARSIQVVCQEAVLALCRHAKEETGMRNLCLAGGVALNCVANGEVLRSGLFDNIWIQPASGDAGGALGAALACCYAMDKALTAPPANGGGDRMHGAYLGPGYDAIEIRRVLDRHGACYEDLGGEALTSRVADALAEGRVVGWFQGRMEFGPRALGNRSILGDARSPTMQKILNLKVKYRESFRPFAPAVLRSDVGEYFELDADSPYMLIVAPVRRERRKPLAGDNTRLTGLQKLNVARSDIPAVTHVDYSARIQTVDEETNPLFYRLIEVFKEKTGYGVLVNTSFNVRDEPIVCTPEDAYRCFMGCEMDMLAIGPFVLDKAAQ